MCMNEEMILKKKEELRLLGNEELECKIRSLSSLKCRYKKMESKVNEMERIVLDERIVREVLNERKEKKVFIYERSLEEINVMEIEEVVNGINNIDSILCIERGKSKDFRREDKIEKCNKVREWLVDRKDVVSGNSLGKVRISDVLRKMEDIKDLEELKVWLEEKSK